MSKHFDMIVADLNESFAAAFAAIKPIAASVDDKNKIVEALHRLRHRSLSLLHEARNA